MKKAGAIFLTYLFVFLSITCDAQTSYQANLLKQFFNNRGQTVLNNWAHPLYERYSSQTEIYVYSGYVKVILFYKGNIEDFQCTYKIDVDSYGNFIGLDVIYEGNVWTSSYYLCDQYKESLVKLYETDEKTKERVETKLGKTINAFSCKDYCLLGLNYYWVTDGYNSIY